MRRTLVIAAIFLAVDGFVYGQGILTVLVSLVVVLARLTGALVAAVRHRGDSARLHLRRAAVWVVAGATVATIVVVNARLAERRAHALIGAVRAYEARHDRLPDRLEAMVPDYLVSPGKHALGWVSLPPFYRRFYVFEESRWGALD